MTTDFRALCAELVNELHGYKALHPEHGTDLIDRACRELATPPRLTPPPLAPDYIDPEHHGEDRELLQVFYAACNAEGGTADEIHLRGIRAVMAALTALATPPPEPLSWPDHWNLIGFAFGREPWRTWLQPGGRLESAHRELSDLMLAVLAHWGRPATPPPEPLRPIPVSERLPEAGDCDTDGSCWVHQPDESWPESPEWKLMRNKYVSTIYRSTHWLPYNAIPFPEVTP